MSERVNIWGKPGCELPNGRLCNACCVLPNIELEGFYTSVAKPKNSPCPHLVDNTGKSGEGCLLHQKAKPEACRSWHCSSLGNLKKADYIAQALSSGQVSESEAKAAVAEIFKEKHSEGVFKYSIVGKARALTRITGKKDLIYRDLDEP